MPPARSSPCAASGSPLPPDHLAVDQTRRGGRSLTIPSMNRKKIIIASVAAVAVLLVAWVLLRKRGADDVTYRFATVEQGSIRQSVTATGNLQAVKTVQVGTQV